MIAPADTTQLASALRASTTHPGPIYYRIGRGQDPDVYGPGQPFTIGRAISHGQGTDLTIIATGSMVHPSLRAARSLRDEGVSVGVLDMHTIKPLDRAAVVAAAQSSRTLLTVEEHSVVGGLGGAVAEVIAEENPGCRLVRHGIKDEYALIGPPTHLYRHYGLDADGIEHIARSSLS